MNRKIVFVGLMLALGVAILAASSLVCLDNIWILQCPDTGVLVDGRILYARVDPLPDHLYRFSHWAGEVYFDPDLGLVVRAACYSTINGLGCDIRYRPNQ